MTFLEDMPDPGWAQRLQGEFSGNYFARLQTFLLAEKNGGKTLYPPETLIYDAFRRAPFEKVRLVILGQDPYINPGQAMGLCFSVPKDCPPPPSLKNIFKELQEDIDGFSPPQHGDLGAWADQGVLLLNAVLSVEQGLSGSHAKKGWERFTDAAIRALAEEREGLVFLLWGNYAKKKGKAIDRQRHLVLEAGHPSPLSVRYFRGCRHFSQANAYLEKHALPPINWRLT